MTLYEIDNAILECVDGETGEIIDFERLEELGLQRDLKIENIALWFKNLRAEAEALKKEIDELTKRKKEAENKMEQLSAKLYEALDGNKFKTPKVSVSYRNSKAVEVDDDFIRFAMDNNLDDLLRYQLPEPNKSAISEALKNGEVIPHAELIQRVSVVIR